MVSSLLSFMGFVVILVFTACSALVILWCGRAQERKVACSAHRVILQNQRYLVLKSSISLAGNFSHSTFTQALGKTVF